MNKLIDKTGTPLKSTKKHIRNILLIAGSIITALSSILVILLLQYRWLHASIPWPEYHSYKEFKRVFDDEPNIWLPNQTDWHLTDDSFYKLYMSLGKPTRMSKVGGYIIHSSCFLDKESAPIHMSVLCVRTRADLEGDESDNNLIKVYEPTVFEGTSLEHFYTDSTYEIHYICSTLVRTSYYDYSFSIACEDYPTHPDILLNWIDCQIESISSMATAP